MIHGARTGAVVVLLAVVGGTLAGCVAPISTPADSVIPEPSPTGSGSASTGASVPATPPQDAKLKDDPDAAAEASSTAVLAVTAYCRPDLSKGAWIAALSPLLTEAGAVAYTTVDPAMVPCTSVTGESSIRDGDSAYVFRVKVPTNAGTYEVSVTRPTTTDSWRVDRMAPPR